MAERSEVLTESLQFDACSFYLEGRFGSDPRLDYLVATEGESAAFTFRTVELSSHPTWRRSAEFLRQLSTSKELGNVRYVWFEYDDGEDARVYDAVPSISVGLEPDYLLRHRHLEVAPDSRSPAIAKAALRSLLPGRDCDLEAQLESCFRSLPPNGAILYLSVMHGRKPAVVKLYIVLPRGSLESYLKRTGWGGDQALLQQLLETYYAPFSATAYLDLTLCDTGVADRIGLATSQFHRLEVELDDPELRWLRLPPEHEAIKRELRAWPGEHRVTRGDRTSVVHRWLDTKAVIHRTKIEYKFYLGFMAHSRLSLLPKR